MSRQQRKMLSTKLLIIAFVLSLGCIFALGTVSSQSTENPMGYMAERVISAPYLYEARLFVFESTQNVLYTIGDFDESGELEFSQFNLSEESEQILPINLPYGYIHNMIILDDGRLVIFNSLSQWDNPYPVGIDELSNVIYLVDPLRNDVQTLFRSESVVKLIAPTDDNHLLVWFDDVEDSLGLLSIETGQRLDTVVINNSIAHPTAQIKANPTNNQIIVEQADATSGQNHFYIYEVIEGSFNLANTFTGSYSVEAMTADAIVVEADAVFTWLDMTTLATIHQVATPGETLTGSMLSHEQNSLFAYTYPPAQIVQIDVSPPYNMQIRKDPSWENPFPFSLGYVIAFDDGHFISTDYYALYLAQPIRSQVFLPVAAR